MATNPAQTDQWEPIQPEVDQRADFLEIVHDFGDPLELLREAISNAIDHKASWIRIDADVRQVDGLSRLVVRLFDNGTGVSTPALKKAFWGLGYSTSREVKEAIGEKGHGTKIYLRSEKVVVRTRNKDASYESVCEQPLRDLSNNRMHKPMLRTIPPPFDHTGTEITITGYADNERSRWIQRVAKDYIQWFTKVGSFEALIGISTLAEFEVHLKCIDKDEYEVIKFGHPFPDVNDDIKKLFDKHSANAADWYVKRHIWKNQRLVEHPEVTFDAVISVEGDLVKRDINPMLGDRKLAATGRYRASDRYGIWLCKDFIPVTRVNDWISGFGSGSNAFVLLHGFVNCQSLSLTANRGDVANTDPKVMDELRTHVQKLIDNVDEELANQGFYTLIEWRQELRTLGQEKKEFERRVKFIKKRKLAELEGRKLLEPTNEAELAALLMTLVSLKPDLFDFEPLDYNANRGIDLIARNKKANLITESEFSYIELKHTLQTKRFNHAFDYIRWIVCWDLANDDLVGAEFVGIEDPDIRTLRKERDPQEGNIYYLEAKKKASRVQVIRLREFLESKLGLTFSSKAPIS
ncbi:MAG: sensor histidine kinase [SAR202 cluster bacterium]|nr:sensor histidine kinase [SAR202 cluster bacterium]